MRQQLQASHLEAVRTAVGFLEQHAAITRREHAGQVHEPVAGLIAALFEHATSRAQDPQLHTHCLIANLAPRRDGTWGTLESRHLFLWQKAAGSVYRATLAHRLRALGFALDRPEAADHFEVTGIPQTICAHFSQRAAAIEAALEELNVRSSASAVGDAIKLLTRTHKQQVDRPTLFQRWAQELDQLGLGAEQAQNLRQTGITRALAPLPLQSLLAQLVEQQSIIRLQDIYEQVAIEAPWSNVSLSAIEHTVQRWIAQGEVVTLGQDHDRNHLYSTVAMMTQERELVAQATLLHQQTHYQLPATAIQTAIDAQATTQGFALSEEQVEGVHAVCQSSLDILQGSAGAGKTTAMRAVKTAYEAAGFRVLGATVARQAANQLQSETGIAASTLAKLLGDLERKQMSLKNTVLLIDEAGQLGSPDLNRLVQAVQAAGAKLILVGEDKQLDAISHGGALRYLSQTLGCSRIESIRRQHHTWAREAVMQLREGQAASALQVFEQHGLLHWDADATACRVQLVQAWHRHQQAHPERHTLVLAQRWADVKPLSGFPNYSAKSYTTIAKPMRCGACRLKAKEPPAPHD